MSAGIRRPGTDWDLTDEELLAAPAKLLSAAQRRRRRQLRNNVAKKKSRAVRKERLDEGRAKVIYCQGFTKRGDPCGGYALTGVKHCAAHLNDAEKAKLGRTNFQETRKNRLKATEMNGSQLTGPQTARQVMEVAVEKLVSRYFRAIGFEFKGFDENNVPIVYDHGVEHGLMLHGESKEGYIEMSRHPDLVAQIAVIEKLWDRVYGKPKQTQVLEGGIKPIQVQPVKNVERSQQIAGLLHRTGAIPHGGRRRAEPVETHDGEGKPSSPPENVVPMRSREDDD